MSLLRPTKGNMYPGWWRWNCIAGCEHGCSYCYMKAMEKRCKKDMTTPVFRDGNNGTKNYLKDNLGSGRKIFCCSSGDAWGEWVSFDWIRKMLGHCLEYPDNEYMFLTKNPQRYGGGLERLNNLNCILGATIETDLSGLGHSFGSAPSGRHRLMSIGLAKSVAKHRTMISVEPAMKFSRDFVARLRGANPDIIYIGADSGNNGLPEPTAGEVMELIAGLREFTDVRLKANLRRLIGDGMESVGTTLFHTCRGSV